MTHEPFTHKIGGTLHIFTPDDADGYIITLSGEKKAIMRISNKRLQIQKKTSIGWSTVSTSRNEHDQDTMDLIIILTAVDILHSDYSHAYADELNAINYEFVPLRDPSYETREARDYFYQIRKVRDPKGNSGSGDD